MQSSYLRLFFLLIFLLLIDYYSFQAIRFAISGFSLPIRNAISVLFWSVPAIALFMMLVANFGLFLFSYSFFRQNIFPIVVILYVFKVLLVPFILLDDASRLVQWAWGKTSNKSQTATMGMPIPRSEFIIGLGLLVSSIPFSSLVFGLVRGPYKWKVLSKIIKQKEIPKAFDGYKVVQISDIHTGSWSNADLMEQAVEKINKLNPDLILFTGDLVNDKAIEVIPFKNALSKLKAKDGVYASLGNHDYGDYVAWENPQEKKQNLDDLKNHIKDLGWKLLLNEHTRITKSGEELVIAGVENWGARGNFSRYGDLNKALVGTKKEDYIILLSHDPSHWRAQVLEHPSQVNITLAGHTHGMQFGADTSWLKWSPVQYMYKEWMDLYFNKNQVLYVNRGLGFIGYAGRVGIDPEITLFTLKSA